ncbi:MAG TPA: hypothetical protein VGO93_21680 [Candidatus Xenobia bacterium]
MTALDVLLRKRGARSVSVEGLLGISLVVLLGTMPRTCWAVDARLPVPLVLYNVLVCGGLAFLLRLGRSVPRASGPVRSSSVWAGAASWRACC